MGYNAMSPEEIRRAIEAEARHLFLRQGIHATEMKELAGRVGISRSTLYKYFPVKAQLAFLVMADVLTEHAQAIAQEIERTTGPGLVKVRGYMHAFAADLLARPAVMRLMVEFDHLYTGDYPDVPEKAYFIESMRQNMALCEAWIHEGQMDGSITGAYSAHLLAAVMVNSISGLTQRILPRRAHIEEEHQETVHAILDTSIVLFCESIKANHKI